MKKHVSLIVIFAMLIGLLPLHAFAEGEEGEVPQTVTLTIEQGEHGTIQADMTEVSVGEEITVTATADDGYHLEEWYLDGKGQENPYTVMIIQMNSDITVTAEFAAHSYGEWSAGVDVHTRWCNNEQCRHAQEEAHTYENGVCSKCEAEAPVVKKYTVTYTDGVEDEVIFEDQVYTVEAGSQIPYFDTEKGSFDRVGYIYDGWTPGLNHTVTADATYTAVWRLCENHYDDDEDTICD